VRKAQQLGRYHLLDRIAFGGMAEIYRAKTFDAGNQPHLVAVKRVLAHLAEDDDFIQMLVDEAKIASLLRHPNVARVYEFARAHGEYFIAMEFVDGKDLRTILERCRSKKKPVPPQHAAYIAAEIASGLHAAHVAVDPRGRPLRIVHRDVSPSNVICSYNGELKLCDFGIAKATLSQVNTKTGVIKGKVKYMSPEQALGRKLDHRSDIFSLGSCLYEMLTRVPPFTATNEMDLLIKVRDAKYRPVRDLVPTVPAELEAITDRCLARSRAHRYQTSQEAATALKSFLKGYMPEYSRSHLGRYIRKQFATEIEKELRLLEEYVLSDEASEDVGENLIADVLGPQAEFSQFRPRPAGDTVTRGADTGASHAFGEVSSGVGTDPGGFAGSSAYGSNVDTGVPTGEPDLQREVQTSPALRPGGVAPPTTGPMTAVQPDRPPPADLDVHEAHTLILDDERQARRMTGGGGVDEVHLSTVDLEEEVDEGLHNAPTLILDHRRMRRRMKPQR
jgi:eukaryotic-like serine/threonine-protein kinase